MLSGKLELFALADVLRFVARSGATGAVNIYRPSDAGRILLVEGDVVGAVVEETTASDGDGVVDAALRIIDGDGGDFALELEPVTGPTRLSVEELLKAVARRRAEWQKILASVGSLDGPLEVTALVPSGGGEISLTSLEWHIAVLIDGHRSLREIARECGVSEIAAATALLAMSNAGLLSLPGGPSADVAGGYEHDSEDDAPEDGTGSFEYLEDGSAEAEDEPEPPDEELDPAELLRELGEQGPAGPRGRRVAPPTREEQRIRLRSR